ncbi:hypothetical protein G5V59_09700 [Nocardioides sp. W3-2-3]|uniref:hypothetical protein n=1 Tax=Nocardioides convexus TaxID=2712224 RepID=UPI0024181A70|nr:hypothetical protein [Nocardioides convexus]NHA00282.1 hypothetical protein [Nocardioides convexus]
MPPAHAGESSTSTQGNYVALSKPARVLSKTFTEAVYWNSANVTALGVQGIPRAGTRALVVVATVKSSDAEAYVQVDTNWANGKRTHWGGVTGTNGVTTAVSGMTVVPVDEGLATEQTLPAHHRAARHRDVGRGRLLHGERSGRRVRGDPPGDAVRHPQRPGGHRARGRCGHPQARPAGSSPRVPPRRTSTSRSARSPRRVRWSPCRRRWTRRRRTR